MSMKIENCLICGVGNPENSHFYKQHSLKQADYYIKYYNKKDLYSKELLPFRSRENYLENDFLNKNNLKNYLKTLDRQSKWSFCKELLLKRKEKKDLIYAPDQFYLKTLMQPPIQYYENTFEKNSYNKICEEIGLINRYNYSNNLRFDVDKKLEYICDSREQNHLKLPNIEIAALKYGDYTIKEKNQGIYIERKSLSDAISTLSQGFDRLIREVKKCADNNDYLIILIEEKFQNLNSFPFLPHTKHSKCSVDFIMHRARQLLELFPKNLQILCCDGRREAVRVIDKIFRLEDVRNRDLMYFYNLGIL